jgi:hypothetical protein
MLASDTISATELKNQHSIKENVTKASRHAEVRGRNEIRRCLYGMILDQVYVKRRVKYFDRCLVL